jgi:hypothetical protein
MFDVEQNNLRGTLPETGLDGLRDLKSWRVSNNSFSGTLPTNLGADKNLKEIWASHAGLIGPIPYQWERLKDVGK